MENNMASQEIRFTNSGPLYNGKVQGPSGYEYSDQQIINKEEHKEE